MCVSSSLKHNRNPVSDHSLRLFEYLPIGTPDTKQCGIYYLENCVVTPYSTDVRPCCFTLKMRNGTTLRYRICSSFHTRADALRCSQLERGVRALQSGVDPNVCGGVCVSASLVRPCTDVRRVCRSQRRGRWTTRLMRARVGAIPSLKR